MTMTRDERIERFKVDYRRELEWSEKHGTTTEPYGTLPLQDVQAVLDRLGELEGVVELARAAAKRMRNSSKLVSPYRIPADRRIWERALYHAGKDLDEVIRAACLRAKGEPS